ncbi:MAG TPA: peptidoglycan DD-metalloendopeptidase family protein [Gammaproteobacteria bacterium]|nr:peptidoglycan DD-metalloendopeptidase family protein [Gammaproteobacteria bacterium]
MKFDYKQKTNQKGSRIFRRTLHVSLGFAAFISLVLSFPLSKLSALTAPRMPTTIASASALHSTAAPVSPANHSKTNASIVTPIVNNEVTLKKTNTFLTETGLEMLAELKPFGMSYTPFEAAEDESPESWHTIKVQAGDTLSKIFTRLGISTKDIHEMINSDPACRHLRTLILGQKLKVQVSEEQQVVSLKLEIAPGNSLYLSRVDEGFQVEHKLVPLEKKLAFGKGEIQNSLFSSGRRAGLDHNILAQMVEIFGWNIDFTLDLQRNDTFRVLYEEKCNEDGERVKTGSILAAEIVNGGKTHQAIRYTDNSGHTSYFTPDGYGMQQAFLRAPVNFTRISSHFGQRNHPIMHRMCQHKGTDYSAPHGTPVQATGNGKVIFMGTRGGYGKVVELQHGARYSTLYAHLSRFPNGFRTGKEVKQGEIIGYVGRTGLATAPHLHYEFRIGGIHHNPLTVMLPKRSPIQESNKRHFIVHAKEMIRLLDTHEGKINVASSKPSSAF